MLTAFSCPSDMIFGSDLIASKRMFVANSNTISVRVIAMLIARNILAKISNHGNEKASINARILMENNLYKLLPNNMFFN
jgi:hypothetical protein